MSDSPDWLAAGPGRFAGTITVPATATPTTLTITVTPYERAILFRIPDIDQRTWLVQVASHDGVVSSLNQNFNSGQWIIAYVNPAYSLSWDVTLTHYDPVAETVYVFVETTLPIVGLGNVGDPIVPTPPSPFVRPYDAYGYHAPAANTIATITLPGVAGKQWIVHYIGAHLTLGAAGGPSGQVVQLLDNAVVNWQTRLSITNVIGNADAIELSGVAFDTIVGHDVTLAFLAAGGANTFETVAIGAWQTPLLQAE